MSDGAEVHLALEVEVRKNSCDLPTATEVTWTQKALYGGQRSSIPGMSTNGKVSLIRMDGMLYAIYSSSSDLRFTLLLVLIPHLWALETR